MLRFHGRIIDHLGIQMYTSPVAAIAELVANAWDADSENVRIDLPSGLSSNATLVVQDDGVGMTFEECQDRYLNVGYNRRPKPTEKTDNQRRVLGRKGIGKFAGFGIAQVIEVDTVSKKTGERTVFELDVRQLRGEEFISETGRKINAKRTAPSKSPVHGTKITLKSLTLKRRPPEEQFRRSMARKFLLLQNAIGFQVWVNGQAMPTDEDLSTVEYDFPGAYPAGTTPAGIRIENGWGTEKLANGKSIRWRIRFFKEPIDDEEMRGVSVFSGIKLVQRPFYFNLSGGLGGQHGQEYVSGQVRADYLDELGEDIVATDRQQVTWENEGALPLQTWGQQRIKELFRLWKELRGESKRKLLEEKVGVFKSRLESLPKSEQKTVRSALTKIGTMEALSDEQFKDLAEAILKAWEQGRLHELINELAEKTDLDPDSFLKLLTEADVLTALNVAEVVKTKLESIRGLRRLVGGKKLENKIRDYIAERPYLLDPMWETFAKETKVDHLMREAAKQAGLADTPYTGRLDLALSGSRHLLVIEFMRPGLSLDLDHISRCSQYVSILREDVRANTALNIDQVTGLLVADNLSKRRGMSDQLQGLKKNGILAYDWETLLKAAEDKLKVFMEIVTDRAPSDARLKGLSGKK
jgi:hypothetical protein